MELDVLEPTAVGTAVVLAGVGAGAPAGDGVGLMPGAGV